MTVGTPVDTAANTYTSLNIGGTNYPQYRYVVNATCTGQDFLYIPITQHGAATRFTIYELTGALTSSPVDASSETSATIGTAVATTLGAAVTSSGQTSLTLRRQAA